MKWIGLADAAGGYYQHVLSPQSRHRSAFILPQQWEVPCSNGALPRMASPVTQPDTRVGCSLCFEALVSAMIGRMARVKGGPLRG